MKIISIITLLISMQAVLAANSQTFATHKKVVSSIADFQSAYWILKDLSDNGEIHCKSKDAQEMFDTATKNIGTAAKDLKQHLITNSQIDLEYLLGISKIVNDSYTIYKSLLFLNEIITKNEIINMRFEQSRFRQMMGIIHLREYVQNGDEEIFTPLNQRNSALAAIMSRIPEEWQNIIIETLPEYLSQTDLRFVNASINLVAPGSITRHFKKYFTNHVNTPQQENFKGDLAKIILKDVEGWTLESLTPLPKFVSREKFTIAKDLIKKSKRFEVPAKLTKLFQE